MKSWDDFALEAPEIAQLGMNMLFHSQAAGLAFLATLRKDGAPRLHPVSLVLSQGRLYVGIPLVSPKCADLIRDCRYALQAFPNPEIKWEEFYISGCARLIQDSITRQKLIDDTHIQLGETEELFELLLERVMYTRLENQGTPNEQPVHTKWRAALESEIS